MRLKEILTNSNKMSDVEFAKKIYANLCNLVWYDYISDECIDFSWRESGGFVASVRNLGEEYMDFYCSGNEGVVDEEIKKLFNDNDIVLFEDFYSSNKEIEYDERVEIFKKNHPVIIAYKRDKKIDNII
jgi:hypothetical protein